MILWRVEVTWANKGRVGVQESIVLAEDAIGALKRAWMTEDAKDLRTVKVEWLSPLTSVLDIGGQLSAEALYRMEQEDKRAESTQH